MGIFKIVGNGGWGGKGEGIRIAEKAGLKIPKTAIITTDVIDTFYDKPIFEATLPLDEGVRLIGNRFDKELEEIFEEFANKSIVIRSSSTTEDLEGLTSAGINGTNFCYLDRKEYYLEFLKADFVRTATKISSMWTPFEIELYHQKHNIKPGKMALVIQEVVGKDSAGATKLHLGNAPEYAGYFNTMFEQRTILGIVQGLGTAAVLGSDGAVFHFSPDGSKILAANRRQKRMDYQVHGILKKEWERDIDEGIASKVCRQLMEVEKRFGEAAGVTRDFGLDIEYAFKESADETPFFLQGRKVVKRRGTVDEPKGMTSVVTPYSFYGFGSRKFDKVVDLTGNWRRLEYEHFKPLETFNEANKGYLLVVPSFLITTSDSGVKYRHFYNAGGILTLGQVGSDGSVSGAGHFALICNDIDILFMDGAMNKEGEEYFGVEKMVFDNKLRVLKKEAVMVADGNRNVGGVYIPK